MHYEAINASEPAKPPPSASLAAVSVGIDRLASAGSSARATITRHFVEATRILCKYGCKCDDQHVAKRR